jgi:cell division protein FtsL
MEKNSKNQKINKEILKEFLEKEKEKNILIHQLVIKFLIVVIIILFIFIIIFKYKIYDIKTYIKILSKSIEDYLIQNEDYINKINKHAVNLFTSTLVNKHLLTTTLKSPSEFNLITEWIGINRGIYLCYKGTFDGDYYESFNDFCDKNEILIIVIQLKNGKRIGGFKSKNDEKNNTIKDSEAFLFNINNKKQFHVNNIENSIIFSKETIISFGEDLVIKNDYLKNNNSYSKFPSSYGNNNDSILDFCGDSKLEILELEIFNILDY